MTLMLFYSPHQVLQTRSIPFSLSLISLSANLVFVSQRLFVVPANPKQKEIPFARVNHNKYMVTDKIAYIGNAVP